jgi:hypothetical protein
MLILFYNTFWGQPLNLPEGIPADVEITTDRRRYAEAQAVVFHIPDWMNWRCPPSSEVWWWLAPKKRPGQLWVAWSLECGEIVPLLRYKRIRRRFDLTMTYRLNADVPFTYVEDYPSPDHLARLLRQPPQPKLSAPLAAAFISSLRVRNGRDQYFRELMRHIPIDSYGKFLRNKSLAEDLGPQSKIQTIPRYKFTLAFENSFGPDYVTEKFFQPLASGSVPVYLGAPNIEDFAPGEHCFINVADFPEPKALAAYLTAVGNDKAAYQAYFAWKEKPFRPVFQKLLALSAQHPFVRLCHFIRARQAPQVQAAD